MLRSEPITHFCAAPTVNTLLCRSEGAMRLPRRVRVTVSASPPSAVLFERMTSLNLHPVHAYGLTETYGPVSMAYYLPEWDSLPKPERYAKMARQGHGVITGLPLRVVKADLGSALVDVAKNGSEIGEVIIQGNLCAKGYYRDPAATAKLFSGGWMHTGDLAVWHDDGAIQILDRAKDIIISGKQFCVPGLNLVSIVLTHLGGENISSVAVESILMRHPAVVEAAVIGVPDEKWGEAPKAFVTHASESQASGLEILTWARESSDMARFMVPRAVEIVDELPKTSTGKIQKKVLRELEVKRRKRAANL